MLFVSLLAKPQCWLITRNCAKMWFLHKDSEQHPLADWCFRPLLTKALISLAGVQEAFFCSCLWILACSHHIKGWTNVSIVVKCARWPRESVFAWEESCSELLKVMSSTLPESDYHSIFFPIPHSKPGAKIDSKPYTPRFLLHVPWMPWSNFKFFFVAFGFSIRRSSPTRHLSKHFPLRNLQGCYPKFSSHICRALHLSLPPRNNDWFRGPALCSLFN